MYKKILAALLALTMVLGLMPAALATETEDGDSSESSTFDVSVLAVYEDSDNSVNADDIAQDENAKIQILEIGGG